jgi:murein peptide amidase A
MDIHQVSQWAKSRNGQYISLFHSSNFVWNESCRPIVMIGGVHGDEPEGVALAEATLNWLSVHVDQVEVPWALIPCLNPDGYQKGQRTNGAGVDLNRNYPAKSWQADAKESRYNPGPSAGSEPEIKAMVHLLETTRPRLVIHCHSWHPCIVVTGAPALSDAKRLAHASGYELKETIGYDTPGSLSQYGWFDQNIPIICIEEQEGTECGHTLHRLYAIYF